MFIAGGVDAVQSPEGKVKAASAVVDPLKDRFTFLPEDTATLVRFNGMVQVGAGGLLALGKFRRLAAWALVASVIPTTYAGHRFWEEIDDDVRAQQRIHFFKNLGLLGGLILAAVDTEGAPSLGWRAHRQADRVTKGIMAGRATTGSRATRASGKAAKAGRRANSAAQQAGHRATDAAQQAGHRATDAAQQASHRASEVAQQAARSGVQLAAPYVRQANEHALGAVRAAWSSAEPYVSAGVERLPEPVRPR